jgi:hypothetical protein
MGKFHGVMQPTIPMGCLTVMQNLRKIDGLLHITSAFSDDFAHLPCHELPEFILSPPQD